MSVGDGCAAGAFYRGIERQIALAQRRAHRRGVKHLHRRAENRRKDALHKFSRQMVDRYQNIVVGDVSSTQLAQTRMAKAVRSEERRVGKEGRSRWSPYH